MSHLVFAFDDKTVQDVVQLHAHLSETLGDSFQYVKYLTKSRRILVAGLLTAAYGTSEALRQAISNSLASYTDPPPPLTRGGYQSRKVLRVDVVAPFSTPNIVCNSTLSMQNNRITNLLAPTSIADAATKGYVDDLTYLTTGTGLTKVGSTLSINADQPTIVSLGTLTGLTSSGIVSITNTTAATSSTSGALRVGGGAGIANNLYVGGFIRSTGGPLSETVTGINRVDIGTNGTPRIIMENGTSGKMWELDSDNVGSFKIFQPASTALTIKGNTPDINIHSTTDASSSSAAALVVNGGLGVAKSVYTSGNLSVPTGGLALNVVTITSNYTVSSSDYYVACNTSADIPITVTLPPSSTNQKRTYQISKVSSDATRVTVATSAGDTISGGTTFLLTSPFASLSLMCTGTVWSIVRYNPGLPSGLSPTIWAPSGIGVDGSDTIAVNTTLIRNMYYTNLTVNSGISLNTAGWRVVVSGTLTLNGIIHMNGVDAYFPTGGSQNISALTTYLGNGTDGASGRSNSGNGSNAVASPYYNAGGAGGNGGASGKNPGGLGGVAIPIGAVDGGPTIVSTMPTLYTGRLITVVDKIGGTTTNNASAWLQGGTGGGSGAAQTSTGMTVYSGGGGGGGGVCIVAAQTITGSGSVQANGGAGANAAATGTPTKPVGGGGGGGGGYAVLLYQSAFNSTITVSANGGIAGTGLADGENGTPGQPGFAYMLHVN